MRGHHRITGIYLPRGLAQIELGVRVEKIHVRLPQALDSSYVLPVAVELIGEHPLARLQHRREQILAKIVGGFGIGLVLLQVFAQLAPREYVNAHRCFVALRLFGLFIKLIDRTVLTCIQDSEARSLFPRHLNLSDGAVCLFLLMVCDHFGIIHFINMITRKDHHIVRVIPFNKGNILINRVCRTLVPIGLAPALIRRQHMNTGVHAVKIPGLAAAYVIIQYQWLVLSQHSDCFNSRIDTVGEREIDDTVFSAIRHRRLCQIFGQHPQAAALPAGQQHGDNFLFWQHRNYLLGLCFKKRRCL